MSNIMDETASGDKQRLSDAELMDLLIKVRSGELSPEEAERLLSDIPGLETGADASAGRRAEQTPGQGGSVHQAEGHVTSAPLGQARSGTLIVDALAAHFTIRSANLGSELFQTRYERSFPSVWVDGNRVTARVNYFSLGALREWLSQQQGDHPRAEYILNSAVPWQLELRSHMTHLEANLQGLRLAGLDGDGNMNHIVLTLDRPTSQVPLHYNGNASSFEIRCPAQCPLRVEVHGNTNAADIAGRKFASKSVWQTPDFDTASGRYALVFTGEASSLKVTYT
jgi:hypothetical protein